MFRAVLEGIAAGRGHVLEVYGQAGAAPARGDRGRRRGSERGLVAGDVGFRGVAQEVWRKFVGASLGNAFLAALAVGMAEPGDIGRWNPVVRRVEPEVVPAYGVQFELWKRLYEQTKDIMHALP